MNNYHEFFDESIVESNFNLSQLVSDTRKKKHMTQRDLSLKTGIAQSDISKLERGYANPSFSTLKRLAEGMDSVVRVQFVPKKNI